MLSNLFSKRIEKNEKTVWVFACYDDERVQSMAFFFDVSVFLTEKHAIDTVRESLDINENDIVKFVEPTIWKAPNVKADEKSFDFNINNVKEAILKYLTKFRYERSDILNALDKIIFIQNPNIGILFFCVDLR